MIVRDLDPLGSRLGPSKTDAVLVVDPNAVLPFALFLEAFEAVVRRRPQVLKPLCLVELVKFAACRGPDRDWARPPSRLGVGTIKNIAGPLRGERADHEAPPLRIT